MKPILEKYYKNRNDIEPGDIILTQGSSLLSKSIQYFDRLSGENEIYNHALLVGYMHGKLIAIESVAKGVHPEFLSYRLSKNVNFCVLKSTGFSTELKENAITKLLTTAESTIKYDNLLLDRGADYFSSTIVIAIRHYDLNSYEKLNDFSIMDQSNLKKSVTPYYENEWKPTALEDKNIEHESFQFYYTMQKMKVYQRSVYIKSENTVHIISLSTLYKDFLNRPESEGFWNSIRID